MEKFVVGQILHHTVLHPSNFIGQPALTILRPSQSRKWALLLQRRWRFELVQSLYAHRYFLRQPKKIWMKVRARQYFQTFIDNAFPEDRFEAYRMSRDTFQYLCDMLGDRLRPRPNLLTKRESTSAEAKVC